MERLFIRIHGRPQRLLSRQTIQFFLDRIQISLDTLRDLALFLVQGLESIQIQDAVQEFFPILGRHAAEGLLVLLQKNSRKEELLTGPDQRNDKLVSLLAMLLAEILHGPILTDPSQHLVHSDLA